MSRLVDAIRKKNHELVQKYLQQGDDVNEGNGLPLLMAIVEENSDIAKLLLENRANANVAPEGAPLIIEALKNCSRDDDKDSDSYKILQLLIDHDADLRQKNDKGKTPLSIALKNGKMQAAKLFLNSATVNINKEEELLSKLARCSWYLKDKKKEGSEVFFQLVKKGADIREITDKAECISSLNDRRRSHLEDNFLSESYLFEAIIKGDVAFFLLWIKQNEEIPDMTNFAIYIDSRKLTTHECNDSILNIKLIASVSPNKEIINSYEKILQIENAKLNPQKIDSPTNRSEIDKLKSEFRSEIDELKSKVAALKLQSNLNAPQLEKSPRFFVKQ